MKLKKRFECFASIHFDFHANDDCNEIGKLTTPEMIQNMIDTVKPDFVQCDCKGHRGLTSYFSEIGYSAPGFIKDNLKIWREVTKKNNLPLYMHYSSLWEIEILKHHPDWGVVNADGEFDKGIVSVFSPYCDEFFIPQMKEIIDRYDVDGMWVDGDNWSTRLDYCEEAKRRFKDETGIKSIPFCKDDEYFYEYAQFCRKYFRKFVKRYVDELHDYKKDFQIASNWLYGTTMPEETLIEVDGLSGDLVLNNAYNASRMEARSFASQSIPFDLQSWSFCNNNHEGAASIKSVIQLKQEAAGVISVGGGCSAYFKQKRDGSIFPWQMKIMGDVIEFCRERKPYCYKTKPIEQVALLNSKHNLYKWATQLRAGGNNLFARNEEVRAMEGVLQNLLDNQYSVQIKSEHQLIENIDSHPLVVIPETRYLEEDFKSLLLKYVDDGGSLLIIGPVAAQSFEKELGVKIDKRIDDNDIDDFNVRKSEKWIPFKLKDKPKGYLMEQWLSYNDNFAGFLSLGMEVKPLDGTKVIGKLYEKNDSDGDYVPCATIRDYGKGKIAAIWINIGERYRNAKTSLSRDFLKGVVNEIFDNPLVKVDGSHNVDVVLNSKENNILIHLINSSGPHSDSNVYVFDEINKVIDLKVTLRLDEKPLNVTLEPNNREVKWKYDGESVIVEVDYLEIYDIIRVQKA